MAELGVPDGGRERVMGLFCVHMYNAVCCIIKHSLKCLRDTRCHFSDSKRSIDTSESRRDYGMRSTAARNGDLKVDISRSVSSMVQSLGVRLGGAIFKSKSRTPDAAACGSERSQREAKSLLLR